MPSEMIASGLDVDLKPAPINPSWIREGTPLARNAILSRSTDGTSFTIVWDCTAGKFEWIYNIDETIYFLDGSAVIADGNSPPQRFNAGDVLFLPRGTVANWHVEEYVRKIAFCRLTLPKVVEFGFRAGRKITRMLGNRQDKSGGLLRAFIPLGSVPVWSLDAFALLESLPVA